MARLSQEDLAAIAAAADGTNLAALARRLRRPYITVAVAAWRIRQAGGWYCRLEWRDCLECGQPFLRDVSGRRGHPQCMQRRAAARRATLRHRANPGTQGQESIPSRWARLPHHHQQARILYNHSLSRRDQTRTRESAGRLGAPWTDSEDRYLLEHWHQTARDQALALGRTLWSVRKRRTHLRSTLGTECTCRGQHDALRGLRSAPQSATG